EHRSPLAGERVHARDHRTPLLLARPIEADAPIGPPERTMRRYRHHPQPVDRPQLSRDFARRSGHASETHIASEEALIRDARNGHALAADRAALLALDELMKPPLPRPIGERAAGEFVDDPHLSAVHEIV